jgi:hypothetical protein
VRTPGGPIKNYAGGPGRHTNRLVDKEALPVKEIGVAQIGVAKNAHAPFQDLRERLEALEVLQQHIIDNAQAVEWRSLEQAQARKAAQRRQIVAVLNKYRNI